jgi:osmotically-inducible protein OsmY
MFERGEMSLRDRLATDGWGETARSELRRAGEGAADLSDRAVRTGDRAWQQAKAAGAWALAETAQTRKRLARAMPRQRARRERRWRVALWIDGFVMGAAAAYFLDPAQGRRRRKQLADRTGALVRSVTARGRRIGRRAVSDVEGFAQRMEHRTEGYEPPNDVTLARKVESEVLGNSDVPSGSVLVNVEEGVVVLRGQVDRPEVIVDLERATRSVDGVRDVENLLHLPGEEAPNKADARG